MYSLLNSDLYKITMMSLAFHQFSTTDVEAKLIVRSKVDLRAFKDDLNKEIDKLCQARFTEDELNYLKTKPYLKTDFINFLEDFTLKRRFVHVYEEDGQLQLRIKGPWVQVILFEVPLLAIIEELYCKFEIESKDLDWKSIGQANLDKKINYLNSLPTPFYLTDFGTRRRCSAEWHDHVVKELKEKVPTFLGTSNMYLAKKYNITNFGTFGHECVQIGQGQADTQLVNSQKYMFEAWAKEYRGDLGIALTDTIGMDAFLKDFDLYLAKLYDGVRHDSGDPLVWGDRMIEHYKSMKIDPMTKSFVFSDNLNFEKANEINEYFKNRAKVLFGIGTFLTNDVGIKPLSIVIKIVRVNGNPVAKLSDEPSKEICEDSAFLSYLKKVFNKG